MTVLTRRAALTALSASCLAPPASADIPRVFHLPSGSMEPTIMQGEYFLAMPVLNFSDLDRGDIVVFRQHEHDTLFVKRIIALAGDRVSFSGGTPTVNSAAAVWAAIDGAFQTYRETLNGRSYLVELATTASVVRDVPEIIVPVGQVYVVGDSRDRSFDSRVPAFGPVALRTISHTATSILRSGDPSREGRTLE